ncbi:MAG: N-6 DNA methylase [Candidatus Methanoperedens sp.]|nr:N-6 DNA methylase [Candidatus Methanoperedens sp.]
MLDQDTKRKIDNARDILVGKVPDPKSQVEQITIALIYKFMDDMDKESQALGGKAAFFTGEFEKYTWSRIFDPRLGGFELIALYGEAITKMNQNQNIPQLFRDIFKNAFLPYRDPETLKSFLKEINEFKYDHSEKLGDAFEYLLSVLGSQGDAGQFRTPRHIIDFIVSVIDPKKNESILDPACGTAGFLISSFKHIQKQNTKERKGDCLTMDEKKRLMNSLVGYDISPDMVRLSLVNMYLHGFQTPKIYEYDTLTSEEKWNETYDVILANPPFMTPKGGIRPHKRFSVQANRSEVLFVDYIMEHISTNGRAGVIVPEGIIFQSANAYKALRKLLVDTHLFAVVSLPSGVFQPYAGVKTSILLMDRTLAKRAPDILFVKIESDGFDLGAQRRPNGKSDLPAALSALLKFRRSLHEGKECEFSEEEKRLAHRVARVRIAEGGDYNLSGERYKETIKSKRSEYELFEINDICEVVRGSSPRPKADPKYYGGTVPRLMISDVTRDGMYVTPLTDFLTTEGAKLSRPMKKGEVVVAVSGNPGLPAILKVDACIHDGFVGFRNLSPKILPEFLYFFLFHQKERSNSQSVGAIFKNLTTDQIKKIKIPLPPLAVQQEIVAEIEGCQKVVDGGRQVVENYKPKIKMDERWEVVELGAVFNKITDSINPKENNGNVKYIGLENIKSGTGNLNGDFNKEISDIKSTKLIFLINDILYGKLRPNLNKVWLATCAGICSTDFLLLRAKNNNVIPKFYSFILRDNDFNAQVLKGIKGAQLPRVGFEYISKIKVPLPPISIQQEIVLRIEEEQKLVEANKKLIEIFEGKIEAKIEEVWGE